MNPKTLELVLRQFALLFVIWVIGLELLGRYIESIKDDPAMPYVLLTQYGVIIWAAVVIIYFLWKYTRIRKSS